MCMITSNKEKEKEYYLKYIYIFLCNHGINSLIIYSCLMTLDIIKWFIGNFWTPYYEILCKILCVQPGDTLPRNVVVLIIPRCVKTPPPHTHPAQCWLRPLTPPCFSPLPKERANNTAWFEYDGSKTQAVKGGIKSSRLLASIGWSQNWTMELDL